MAGRYGELPVVDVAVHADRVRGPLETWRCSVGQGGINPLLLPDRVVEAAARLHPRLVRIFLQEFFFIRDGAGGFDWSRMDAYIDALTRTGATIVAAITIKPPELYPRIDQAVWQPTDWSLWQRIVAAMVERYSVQRRAVTHWEIGNEPDIGENGGSPYLIPDPADYAEYYTRTAEAVRRACPAAKVGACGNASASGEPLPGFLKIAAERRLPVDFVSWHRYGDDPVAFGDDVRAVRAMASGLARPAELMITEHAPGFESVSVPEQALEPRRPAAVAAALWEMIEAGLDWSFYYHLWDQVCYPEDFEPFFRDVRPIMVRHWNEVPHRFALFDLDGGVRPTYFLFWMLERMAAERCAVTAEAEGLRVLASRGPNGVTAMLVNYGPGAVDRVAAVQIAPLAPGRKELAVHRIDAACRWRDDALDMTPVERREVAVPEDLLVHVYLPADTVAMVELRDRGPAGCTSSL